MFTTTQGNQMTTKPATPLPDWSGSPCQLDPDNFWMDADTGERVSAATGKRKPYTVKQRALLARLGEGA